ncbi:MAG: DEAD/DEAH box helicase, partial [Planctomycetaceae bacterium]|nr:DEAD/DEAH box helicase [Planctomycetaceae bacterium]
MDAFSLRNRLINDYRGYVEGFLTIADERIRDTVNAALAEGALWPEPLIQLNPTFSPGETIDALVQKGTLHPECSRIFRIGKNSESPLGHSMKLHRHQSDALEAAQAGDNYVLTTGTGSGKSLAYILPIVDHILRVGSGRHTQAIIVYPMNALANSQLGELRKYLDKTTFGDNPPVTVQRYTGQEKQHERDAILQRPPDILLTNYVMLDLMLTRPHECKPLITAAQSMRFIVLDELHTYRGRQGADIALLLRRLANSIPAEKLQYVGTSATMSTEGTFDEQRKVIANVASRLFGAEVKPQRIIGETLERSTSEFSSESLRVGLMEFFQNTHDFVWPDRHDDFVKHPLAVWLENILGLRSDATGRLVRQSPKSIGGEGGLAAMLAAETGEPAELCTNAIHDMLLAGTRCAPSPSTGKKPFTFRVHQFFSRGDTVYATLGRLEERHMTLQGQQFFPGPGPEQRLYPLSFCRECGQEFYGAIKDAEKGVWLPRPFDRRRENDSEEAGYLLLAEGSAWPDDPQAVLERIPEDWLELHQGNQRVRKNRIQYLPQPKLVALDGTPSQDGVAAFYLPLPFRLCPNCGVSYGGRTGEASKLATLGTGGRSTATTILALATLREMRDSGVVDSERKLLDFTDNRQDASLQAGHFNDFIETTLLRSALCRALSMAGPGGLRHEQLAPMVFAALAMPKERYLSSPEVRYDALERANQTFRDLLAYRLYVDLRRGWRITAPNLEQIDLLRFEYPSLKDLCACESDWQRQKDEIRERAPALQMASPALREKAAIILLDHLRRELAIKVMALDPAHHDTLKSSVWGQLREPWRFEDGEKLTYASVAWVRSHGKSRFDRRGDVYLSPRSGLSLCLKRMFIREGISFDHPQESIEDLLRSLSIAGLVECVRSPVTEGDAGGWQLNASAMVWKAGEGECSYQDPVRVPRASAVGARPHRFFIDLYRENCAGLETLYAREHTAQVVQD